MLNKPTSQWLPMSPEYRFDRNHIENTTPDDTGNIGESVNDDALDIRSLMIDIARNFHSLETIKVI